MEKLLIFIKHRLPQLWSLIDKINLFVFTVRFGETFNNNTNKVMKMFELSPYVFRELVLSDLPQLKSLIQRQPKSRLKYFNPHKFDEKSLKNVFKNTSFVKMGVFFQDELVGYFFLRCFANKQCFVGRLIDEPYEGKGIGRIMNEIMYNIGWESGFQVMSTISKNNKWVMRSHANNKTMKIVKELDDDFLLVEFLKPYTLQ
jgi:hypothetical protein